MSCRTSSSNGGRCRHGGQRIQRSLTASHQVTIGVFEVDMQTREGGLNTPPTLSGLDGYIRFVPGPGAPNSNGSCSSRS